MVMLGRYRAAGERCANQSQAGGLRHCGRLPKRERRHVGSRDWEALIRKIQEWRAQWPSRARARAIGTTAGKHALADDVRN